MRQIVVLSPDEITELCQQAPDTASGGGFQSLLVRLQKKVNHSTQELILNEQDLEEIPRYAFDYKNGGWETRLVAIFGRTLGPQLGRAPSGAA
jgi:hypothetical protein